MVLYIVLTVDRKMKYIIELITILLLLAMQTIKKKHNKCQFQNRLESSGYKSDFEPC